MSYILDALKKSEEERRKLEEQQRAPYISAAGGRTPPRRRMLSPALILSAFIFSAVLILAAGWWYVNLRPIDHEAASLPAEKEPAPAETAVLSEVHQAPVEVEPVMENAQPASRADSTVFKEIPVDQVARPTDASLETIPLLSELPFSTQSMLPEMQFRGHVYSPTPEQRMIMINAAVIREGDLVAPELILSEITETGLIMKYRETVFQVQLF